MYKIMGLIAVLSLSSHAHSAAELESLLNIRPESKLAEKIPLQGSSPSFEYEIELKKGLVESVRIDFISPHSSKSLIAPDTKGHCLTELPSGSVVLPRFYFFDTEKNYRYELSPIKEIKSVLIKKIPGARENRACTFKEFDPGKALKPQIKKVK